MLWCQDNPRYIQNVAECADVIGFCFVSVSVSVFVSLGGGGELVLFFSGQTGGNNVLGQIQFCFAFRSL